MNTPSLSHLVLAGLLFANSGPSLQAQTFTIGWSKIAGGGGTSVNGPYTLNTTAGQPVANGPATSGPFSFTSGFWAFLSAGQSFGEPIINCPAYIVISPSDGCAQMPDESTNTQLTAGNSGPVTVQQSIPAGTLICADTNVTLGVYNACCTNTCTVPVLLISPPTIQCPNNIVVSTTCSGEQVYYTVMVSSASCSNDVSVVASPPSGSFFPLGTNTVTAVATDCYGNSSSCSFTVTVNQTSLCVGQTWTRQTNGLPALNQWAVASSSDGTHLVVVDFESGGRIYTSADSGQTWTQTGAPAEAWYRVASSSDGTHLVAVVQNGGIYTSTDGGQTWVLTSAPSENWQSIASSPDGTHLVAGMNTGPIYISTDGGQTWVATSAPSKIWTSLASLSDGTRLFATASFGGIYTSADGGLTWTVSNPFNEAWESVAASSDGTHLVAVVYSGGIFTSSNTGQSWTQTSAPTEAWESVASSSDGTHLVAVFNSSGTGGGIYISEDSGQTWTLTTAPTEYWQSVASSSDGSKLVAVGGGLVYTSDCTNSQVCCIPPPTNMVLWLPFDETRGNLSANLASPANYGTQVGNPMSLSGQYVANSLLFNGANYVTVPDYPGIEIGTNGLTIDAWIFDTGSTSDTNVIVDKYSILTQTGYRLWLDPIYGLNFSMDNQNYSSPGSPNLDGQWHFVAVSVNQSTSRGYFYLDGSVVGTFTSSPANLSNTNALWVGASAYFNNDPSNHEGRPWVGALDEVEVYNRALSTNELFEIFSANTAGKCKPCCYLNDLSIHYQASGNSIEVIWGGCGILEQATNLLGPWNPIQNAASPYIVPATGKTMFYRLQCP